MCIRDSPFGGTLDNALRGKVIAEHPAGVARLKRVSDISGCQILFVAASESHLLPEVLAKIRGQYVLVIGESDDFASSGGAIQFTLEENRVRFFINPDAADRAGLKISSKPVSYTHLAARSDGLVVNLNVRVRGVVNVKPLGINRIGTVSYTHLDVYKRQRLFRSSSALRNSVTFARLYAHCSCGPSPAASGGDNQNSSQAVQNKRDEEEHQSQFDQ